MADTGSGERRDGDPLVSCELQGGTVSVYDDEVVVERSSASMFEDKTIPMGEIRDVEYSGGIVAGYLQVVQDGVEPGEAGFLSKPVDENTLYFPRGKRSDVRRLRDAILERMADR